MKPRVTLEELSRLADGQATAAERRDLERRLADCPLSRALKERIDRLHRCLTEETLTSAGPAPVLAGGGAGTGRCLDEDTLLALADNLLPEERRQEAEEHLLECEPCLALTLAHLRTAVRMQAGRWPELPPEVRENREIRVLVHVQERPPANENWEVMEVSLAAATTVSRGFHSGNLNVEVTLIPLPAEDRARLECAVSRARAPRGGQVITAINADTRRKLFTGRTDAQGKFVLSPLPPGRYHLHFQGTPLKLEIVVEE